MPDQLASEKQVHIVSLASLSIDSTRAVALPDDMPIPATPLNA
jgi:hypothetical protein